MPEEPGPPGFVRRWPLRWDAGTVALNRARGICARWPLSGSAYSRGTVRVVQSRVGSDGHGDQYSAARAGTACKSWVDHCRAILITDTSQAGEGRLSLFKRECQKKVASPLGNQAEKCAGWKQERHLALGRKIRHCSG